MVNSSKRFVENIKKDKNCITIKYYCYSSLLYTINTLCYQTLLLQKLQTHINKFECTPYFKEK